MKNLKLLFSLLLITSCSSKIDLSKLSLTEEVASLISIDEKPKILIDNVEYPFAIFLEDINFKKYSFMGIPLKSKIMFQIDAKVYDKDRAKTGGGHFAFSTIKNNNELLSLLEKYKAKENIYGIRIFLEKKEIKNKIRKTLIKSYGEGTRNPNSENGLYWKLENKYIFFAPDYNRLTILNNSNLSGECYWDNMNGFLNFSNCNKEKYFKNLMSNHMVQKEDVKNIKLNIDSNWNINKIYLNRSDITTFKNSSTYHPKRFKSIFSEEDKQYIYPNINNTLFLYFTNQSDDVKKYLFNGYSINDLTNVNLHFENGLVSGMLKENVLKIFEKEQIENFNEINISNFLVLKNKKHEIKLIFNSDNEFSSLYVTSKNQK